MNPLDYVVLLGTMLGIAGYGIWATRDRQQLSSYLKGSTQTRWITIGLSVMATQASAITFLSTPGQGYQSGLGFVQNYFGAPLALIVIAAIFLPIYRRLKVYTAYEYLGQRFDGKTRLLGAGLFLLQRGMGAGITIYAPAIVLSSVFGWRLDVTIICSGVVAIAYTAIGGTDAVSLTQKYQIGVIFAGMVAAFCILVARLPAGLGLGGALAVAGGFDKLQAVDFSTSVHTRYTFWSGTLGGMFLALAYFGTDQSQVQRYIGGSSLRESRMGLMFNSIFKIPMQFFILLLGVMLFVFYQFQMPPVMFNQSAWEVAKANDHTGALVAIEQRYASAEADREQAARQWLEARHSGGAAAQADARAAVVAAGTRSDAIREEARLAAIQLNRGARANDADYVFVYFILRQLPHGLIGLLVAVFFAAALASKSAELNALGSTTTVDIYRHLVKANATDAHYVAMSKLFTVLWGLVALGFALFANLKENLIQAANIIGSVFYGVVLGLFLVAFFLRKVGGTAVFWAAVSAQCIVFVLYYKLNISYLWFNVIGCVACMVLSLVIQAMLRPQPQSPGAVEN